MARNKNDGRNRGNEKWNTNKRMPWPSSYFDLEFTSAQSCLRGVFDIDEYRRLENKNDIQYRSRARAAARKYRPRKNTWLSTVDSLLDQIVMDGPR